MELGAGQEVALFHGVLSVLRINLSFLKSVGGVWRCSFIVRPWLNVWRYSTGRALSLPPWQDAPTPWVGKGGALGPQLVFVCLREHGREEKIGGKRVKK